MKRCVRKFASKLPKLSIFRTEVMSPLRNAVSFVDSECMRRVLGQEAEEVFVNMLTIAESDGEIEPEEQKVLEEVGRRLGLRVEDYI